MSARRHTMPLRARLEGNVVVSQVIFGLRHLGRGRGAWCRLRCFIAAPATYELHVRRMDFERVALLIVSIRPLFQAQSPFYVDRATFGQVL